MNPRQLLCATALLSILASARLTASPAMEAAGTPTPSPTPGPSTPATVPTTGSVLDQMMRAWQAAGSAHFVMSEKTVIRRKGLTRTIVGRDVGDIAWQTPPVFQMTSVEQVTVQKPTSTSVNFGKEVQRYSENRLAVRLGFRKWSCNRFFGYSALPGSPLWDETSPWGIRGNLLGVATIKGAPAYHVQLVTTVAGPKGSTHPRQKTVREYFASTADWLPLRIRLSYQDWTKNASGIARRSLTFSHFGESVHVTLPAACMKK